MFDNEKQNNNSNNSNNLNEHPQEYYYTAGSNNYNSSNYSNNGNPYTTYQSAYDYNQNNKKAKKPKKQIPFLKKAVSFVCLGALFGVAAGTAFSIPTYITNKQLQATQQQIEQSKADSTSIATTQTSPLTVADSNGSTAANSDVSAIAANCLPSVVSITNKGVTEVRTMFGTYQQDTESSGSGIIIGENDTELLIVTNYHVVSGSNELSVVFSYDEDNDNPSVVSAKLKGYAADKDLAVISVSLKDVTADMRSQIKIATVGDSSKLELGQEVVAIGNALGYGQSVTTGIISALNREVTVTNDDGTPITNKLIQTDAAINPGNSGGALLNMNGELIGINSVKVSSSQVEGMGYAIPISDVQSIIEDLMLKETRDVVDEKDQGYLGIGGTDVTSDISKTYDMPMGVYINTIYDNSPAGAAGLSKGNIITKFDGQTISSMSELKTLLTYYKSGETVKVTAMVQGANGYEEKEFDLTLASKSVFGDDSNAADENSQNSQPQTEDQNSDNGYGNMNPYSFFWPFGTP